MDSVDKRQKCLQHRRERERSRRASETAEEQEERLRVILYDLHVPQEGKLISEGNGQLLSLLL